MRSWSRCAIRARESIPSISNAFSTPYYTTKPSGMGLGLSICRSIADAHGGRLWADANEPGGGVFRFTLPAGRKGFMNFLPTPAPLTALPTQPTRPSSSGGVRRKHTVSSFPSFGARARAASSG